MNPLRITAANYRSFPNVDLDLPHGCIAVLGENGAGKSSIVNAIDLTIFGPESRSLADTLSDTAPDDDLLLELELEHAGTLYRIRRTYSARGRGKTTLDFEQLHTEDFTRVSVGAWFPLTRASAKETQELIEATLGLSRETFRASAFLAQGDGAVFTEAQPRDRKRILAEVLGLDVWDGLLEKARAEKRTADLRLADVNGMIERAEPELAQRDGLTLQLAQARENEQTATASLAEAVARLATARDALTEARGRVERRAGVEKAVQSAERARSELRQVIAEREARLEGVKDLAAKVPELAEMVASLPALEAEQETLRLAISQWEERRRLEAEHAKLMREAEALREREVDLLARAMGVEVGVGSKKCDRCAQTLDAEAARRAAESYRAEANEHSFRANNIEEHDLVTLNGKISALPAEEPDRARFAKLPEMITARQNARASLARYEEAISHGAIIETEIQKMRAELPEREALVGTARADLDALGPHDPRGYLDQEKAVKQASIKEEQTRAQIILATREMTRIDERLSRLDTLAADLKKVRAESQSLRADLDVLLQLERAFSPNGIPALIVENSAIPYLETEATRILSALGTSYQLELRTQAALKSGDGLRDTLDVVVIGDHGERPYETFSGGERTRINLALRIALARLLAHRRGAESRLLAIDEPEFLDEQGTAALVDVLRELEGDFDRLYLISHVPALRDAFDQVLTVTKDDTGSRIEQGYTEPVEVLA